MEIKLVEQNKKDYLDLLLWADEQEDMIDKYLERGDLFALFDGDLKTVCVVTKEDDVTFEIKNLATYPQYQRQGYGSKMIKYVLDSYSGKGEIMKLGTGDVPTTLSFYENCGFKISYRVKNFFTDNYNHPMFEDDVQLVDMVYLSKSLL